MHKCLIFNVCAPRWSGRPAGPYRIAHVLREHGWDAEVIDFMLAWTNDELKSLALSRIDKDTKFIGFGHLYSMWPIELELYCAWIKERWPHVKIISGSSVLPDFQSKTIDYYIQGFAELAIFELVSYLFSNGTRPRFDTSLQIQGQKIIKANDQYPAYPMKSLMIKYEDRDFIQSHEWLTIEFARGCKFECAFCNFPVLGVKGDYSRDADDAYEQLQDTYDRFGVNNYIVSDETFNDRTEKITKFADVVDKLSFTPWFSGYVRADLLVSRPQDREELLRMNFLGHYYGIESFNTESAKSVGKGMDGERLKNGLIDVRQYFENQGRNLYRGEIGLIIGLPYETISSCEQSLDWLLHNWKDQAYKSYYLFIPLGDKHKSSKMSLDYAKYGYTEIDVSKKNSYNMKRLIKFDDFVGGSTDGLLWQNSDMDIFEASDIVKKYDEVRNENFGLGVFLLSNNYVGNLDVKERLKLSVSEGLRITGGSYGTSLRGSDSFLGIQQYIDSKLNHQ